MNDNQIVLATLAIGVLAAVILFRKQGTSPSLPTVLEIGDSQTNQSYDGPAYLTYNMPFYYGPPVTPFAPMPKTSVGEIGQVPCGGC